MVSATLAKELEDILDEIKTSKDPTEGLAYVFRFAARISELIKDNEKTGIIQELEKWIKRFLDALKGIAGRVGAEEFSVSVTAHWPPIISIAVSFKAQPPSK